MPKIIFDSTEKNLIPEHLLSQAKEIEGGGWELDAKGVLSKNKELLKDNAKLSETKAELEAAKEAAEASRDEWKGKAKIPAGHEIVSEDVAKRGKAAVAAEITEAEMPTLKTAKEDLQKKIDGFENEKVIAEVAEAKKFNSRFVTAAKDKGLKFEKVTEKVDGKDTEDFVVLNADGTKPKVDDFLKSDAYFKEFAPTFVSEGEGGNFWARGQESGKGENKPTNPVDARMSKYSPPPSAAVAKN